MTVRVLFFGLVRDVVGRGEEERSAPEGATLQSLLDEYLTRFPALAGLEKTLVVARNAEFAPRTTAVEDGDEIALLPPVSGGAGPWLRSESAAGGHFFALTREPIDTRALQRELARPEDGAIATFEGIVRNHSGGRATQFLDYECYEPMALATMARIGREIAQTHAIGRIAMVHRLGRLQIGEASVAVVVSAPHRKPAFDACLEGINRLKKLVPVWKKEHFADGAVWVEGEWDSSVLPR